MHAQLQQLRCENEMRKQTRAHAQRHSQALAYAFHSHRKWNRRHRKALALIWSNYRNDKILRCHPNLPICYQLSLLADK